MDLFRNKGTFSYGKRQQKQKIFHFEFVLKAAAQNKYFIIMFLMVMALALYQNVNGTVSTYYAQYVLGNAEIMGGYADVKNSVDSWNHLYGATD